jgi:phosphatidylserine/phosphatidylglycerophosphate/cardiolipin synthase-like enzyme
MNDTRFVTDEQIYESVIIEAIPRAESFVWIATSDLKDLHVRRGRRMAPFLGVISELVDRNVSVRLLHAKEPGPMYRKDFDRYPNLIEGMEQIICPRVHFKAVVVDGKFAYTGSANLTGAGMGAKTKQRRNFESGIITTNPELIEQIMLQFDQVWIGDHCEDCKRKEYCADFRELLLM